MAHNDFRCSRTVCVPLFLIALLVLPPASPQTLFKVPVDVIVVNAIVTDKDGKPVTDLTANDFRVYEDDKLQSIQTFALEVFGPAESGEEENAPTSREKVFPNDTNVSPRLISIVIDDLTLERSKPDVPFRIADAIANYIKSDMGANDQVAILSGSRMVKVPFSNNKQYLLDEVAALPGKLNTDHIERRGLWDYEALLLSDVETEMHRRPDWLRDANQPFMDEKLKKNPPFRLPESVSAEQRIAAKRQIGDLKFRYHNLLETLRLNIRALRHFEGKKSIVFFSPGFLAPRKSDTAYQMQDVIDLALRSGIAFNTMSAWDIYPEPGSAFDIANFEDTRRAQEEPLIQMAADTGGLFSSRRNNLSKGLRDIIRRQAYVYTLSYNSPGRHADGTYHAIRLEVTRPGLTLSYRRGYYAPKEQLVFENSRRADIINALDAPGNMNQIPVTLAYASSQVNDAEYAVSFTTHVDIRKLQFQQEDARRRNTVSIILAAYDEMDNFINGVDKSVEFRLLEGSYKALLTDGLSSRVQLTLPPGRYKIKAVVREHNQGKMGSLIKAVEIP
jgi:VWFA-related protein